MNKENILAWMQIIAGFIVLFIVVVTFQWFGSTTYVVLSVLLLAIGIGCTALSLACHDGLKSPRLVYLLVVLVGGALLLALPYA